VAVIYKDGVVNAGHYYGMYLSKGKYYHINDQNVREEKVKEERT
jgi:hypothetical protein